MSEFTVINPAMNEEVKAMMRARKRASALRFALMVSFLLIALAMLTQVAHADGAYNYNITIQNKHKIVAIGNNVVIDAYVAYNSLPVKEYPCIITFYDYKDNSTMLDSREYTDELGQLHYSEKLSDTFLYTNNYTYSVACSNSTATGSVYAQIGSTPNWFYNWLVYTNENAFWMGIVFFVGVIITLFGLAHLRNSG